MPGVFYNSYSKGKQSVPAWPFGAMTTDKRSTGATDYYWDPTAGAVVGKPSLFEPVPYTSFVQPDQTGIEQTLAKGFGLGYNAPGFLVNAPGAVVKDVYNAYNKWIGKPFAKVAGPVVDNAVDWAGTPGTEYQAKRQRDLSKLRVAQAPDYAPQFSPTGEGQGNPWLGQLAGWESGGNNFATNPRSSAAGPFQFIDQTWLGHIKNDGPKYGLQDYATQIQQDKQGRYYVPDPAMRKKILDLRFNPQVAEPMALEHTAQVQQGLRQKLGRDPTVEELHMGWVFDVGPTAMIAKAPAEAPVGPYVSAAAISANPGLFPNGAKTTVGQLRAEFSGQGQGTRPQGPLATLDTQLPGPPPERSPAIPVDWTAADQAFAGLRPEGPDEKYLKDAYKNLVLSGLASGIESTRGGIPGMLARMAGGLAQARAQSSELGHEEKLRASRDLRQWQGQGLQLELTKAEQRAREGNTNQDIAYENKAGKWNYGVSLAKLARLDVGPDGTLTTQSVGPDGQLHTSITDIGSQILAMRQQQGIAGGLSGNLPNKVKSTLENYIFARKLSSSGQPGGDALFFGTLADEIASSPYKYDILGGDQKQYQAEIMKQAAAGGGSPQAMQQAEINYITHALSQAAKQNPDGLKQILNRAAGYGLIGPRIMAQQ